MSNKDTLVKQYDKNTLNNQYINLWLHNTYGLDSDDILNAGEIEELLQCFIMDYDKKQ